MNKLPWWAIDSHVHCRDEEQSHKATIASVIELALSQGVGMIIDMPNPARPVTNRQRVYERLALVPKDQREHYWLYVGLTGEEGQISEAVWCYNNIPEVVGFKMFAGKSVGDLSVTEMEDQRMVYRWLTKLDYRGPVLDHCEKERWLYSKSWNAAKPRTHGQARPKVAEIESVRDQIRLVTEEGFTGWLHICHVSCPESVLLVHRAKMSRLKISCGVTPHHLMWDNTMMDREDGLIYKMNPPLRGAEDVRELQLRLRLGMIDVIETDHAPHTLEEKMGPPYLSGYPSLELYGKFVTEFLPGLGLSQDEVKALTRDNILRIFGDKLKIAA